MKIKSLLSPCRHQVMVPWPARKLGKAGKVQGGTVVSHVSFGLLSAFVVSMVVGGSCLFLVHCRCPRLARCGRWLFVAVLFALGAAGLVAAHHRIDALSSLGLLIGFLTVAMLWEPAPELERRPHS